MKERPILFSGAMVRAILEGRKTVTRRAVKGHQIPKENPTETDPTLRWTAVGQKHHRWGFVVPGATEEACASALGTMGVCPYGKPGDRLWVRETWARVGNVDPGYLTYRSTYPKCLPPGLENVPADIHDIGERWRPSIHMPRAACRIVLEITAVRVERLRDISGDQALAEGIYSNPAMNGMYTADGDLHTSKHDGPVEAFAKLWESINGAGSWAANPWVWVVEFKRVTP
ncbi:hypothetical protein [Pseudomonas sp. SO81]|uniref:hypothetical protein n=1 Tax=Pseudomonas sp. SO81 TaxID=2983246 RepID=UPI0025A40179|nr:hypothetical protein [Pseudomonas sp. SO81]WJN61309.1 Phage protein [Pseudomonas sp. SO81]